MAPKRHHPTAADVRAHLLDAALRVFAASGYETATVRDIAREAGVASGLLYHYFPGKQAVLEALFERSAGLVMEAFARVATIPDPRTRLADLIRTSAQLVRQHEPFWRISYGVRFQHGVLGALEGGIAMQGAQYQTLFTTILTEMGHPAPEIEARLLSASLDGVFQQYVLAPADYPLDAVVERLIAVHAA